MNELKEKRYCQKIGCGYCLTHKPPFTCCIRMIYIFNQTRNEKWREENIASHLLDVRPPIGSLIKPELDEVITEIKKEIAEEIKEELKEEVHAVQLSLFDNL